MSNAPRIPIPFSDSLKRLAFTGLQDPEIGEQSRQRRLPATSPLHHQSLSGNYGLEHCSGAARTTGEAHTAGARLYRAVVNGRVRQLRKRRREVTYTNPLKQHQREKYVRGLPKLDQYVSNFELSPGGLTDKPRRSEEDEPDDTVVSLSLPASESTIDSFQVTSANCIVNQAESLLSTRFENIYLTACSEQNTVSFADLLLLIQESTGAALDELVFVQKSEFEKFRDAQSGGQIDQTLPLRYSPRQRTTRHQGESAQAIGLTEELPKANMTIADLHGRLADFEILGNASARASNCNAKRDNPTFNRQSTVCNIQDASNRRVDLANTPSEYGSTTFDSETPYTGRDPMISEFGRIVDEDEAGPIFDYGELEAVHMRGGGYDFLESGYDNSGDEEDFAGEQAGRQHKRRMLEEDSDKVDRNIPKTWGIPTVKQNERIGSVDNSFGYQSDRASRCAPAFAPFEKEIEAAKNQNKQTGFRYARYANEGYIQGTWTTKDPISGEVRYDSRAKQRMVDQDRVSSRDSPATSELNTSMTDSNAPENSITAAVFGEAAGLISQIHSPENTPGPNRISDDLPGIEPVIREQFLSVQQMGQGRKPRTAFEQRNASLLSANSGGGDITMTIGGEEIICRAQVPDRRLQKLDRYGKYIGRNEGDISKRNLRGHLEHVAERDEEMLRASAEYKRWQAMTLDERLELLNIRRQPIKYWNGSPGADIEDQHEVDFIPLEYSRTGPAEKRQELMKSAKSVQVPGEAESSSGDSNSQTTSYRHSTVHSWRPLDNCGDTDDDRRSIFSNPALRNGEQRVEWLKLVLRPNPHAFKKSRKASNPSAASSVTYGSESSAVARYNQRLPHELYSDSGWTGTQASNVTRTADDLFDFDDTPELQVPEDIEFHTVEPFDKRMDNAFKTAEKFAHKWGRAVVVRLHKLVKFTPHAIAKRVFGGTIQELQLHPSQDLAIVIFLHAAEARSFMRHVSTIRTTGWNQDIVQMQIEADWGKESESILGIQPRLVAQNLQNDATRVLKLHRIPLHKTKEVVFQELGIRLGKLLVSIHLQVPKQIYLQMALGRQAVIEFASIKDAIESREALLDEKIDEYTMCAPEFANDPAANPIEEKSYCECMGCREVRAYRA